MTHLTEQEFAKLRSANPDLFVTETTVRPRAAIPVPFEDGAMALRFQTLWFILGGPTLTKEHRFDTERRWRLDYVHLPSMIAIEIHGGVWSGGRHVRGGGFLRDREKMNAAQLAGWRVVELGAGMITPENLEPVIREMTK